jgi:hypothetical protein
MDAVSLFNASWITVNRWYMRGRWMTTLGATVAAVTTGSYWCVAEGASLVALGVAVGSAAVAALGFGFFWMVNRRMLGGMGLRF